MEIFINGKKVFELPDGEDVIIRAKDKEEACKIAQTAYENCEIVLSAENFVCADFKTTIADEPKTEI